MPTAGSLPALGPKWKALKQDIGRATPTDPKFEDSFAEQLGDLCDQNRWILRGTASDIWECNLRERVQELVVENSGKIYKGHLRSIPTTWGCWMMGPARTHAHPTVVIFLDVEDILKKTMRVMLRCGVLKSNGFGLKGCPKNDLQPYTEASTALIASHADEIHQGPPMSLCGAEIQIGSPVRSVTLGGGIILNGQYHGLTVAHAFTDDVQGPLLAQSPHREMVLYDSDWALASSDDDSVDDANTSVSGSQQPSPSSERQGDALSSGIVSESQSDGEDTDAVEGYSEETDEDYEEDEDDHKMLDYERNEEDDEMEDNEDAREEAEEEDGEEDDEMEDNKDAGEEAEEEDGEEDEVVETGQGYYMDLVSGDVMGNADVLVEEDEWLESSDGGMVDDIRSNRDEEEHQDIELKQEDAKVIKFAKDGSDDDELAERVVAMSSQHPLGDGDENTFDDMDWAVIEIRNPFHHGMNGVLLDKDARKWLYFKRFKKSAPRNAILVATRHGIVRDIGTGSASSIKLRRSSHFRNIWSIRPEEALGIGDSGAWVVEAKTGDVYGVLVAGSAMLQEAYVIPLWQILAGINSAMEGDFPVLPSINDVLYSASRFKNGELVNSLLAAGADPAFLYTDPDKRISKPESPPPSDRPNDKWYCSHCAMGGPMSLLINDYCSFCGNKREPFPKKWV